jgi:GH24 family phage-related lysozyme (muramidase)
MTLLKRFEEHLKKYEGTKPYLYDCGTGEELNAKKLRELKIIKGYITTGTGRNIEARPFSADEIALMRRNDMKVAFNDAVAIFQEQFENFPEDIQLAILDSLFNMGIGNSKKGFRSFRKMIGALKREDYTEAAVQYKDSGHFREHENRARVNKDYKLLRDYNG